MYVRFWTGGGGGLPCLIMNPMAQSGELVYEDQKTEDKEEMSSTEKGEYGSIGLDRRGRKVSLNVLFVLNTTLSYSTGPGSSVLCSVVI